MSAIKNNVNHSFSFLGLFAILTFFCQFGVNEGWASTPIYSSGFEADEGYLPGDLHEQDKWSVDQGQAEVWDGAAHSGLNSSRITPNSSISRPLDSAKTIVMLNLSLQALATERPSIIGRDKILALYVDRQEGLMAFDGDGYGGGEWHQTGFFPNDGMWFDVSIQVNLETRQWDLSLNGRRYLSRLGFVFEDVASMKYLSLSAQSQGDTLVDDVSAEISPTPPSIHFAKSAGAGFEPEEGFQLGNLDGQLEWTVKQGKAEVWEQDVYSGLQSAHVEPDSEVEAEFIVHPEIQTFTAWLKAVPSQEPDMPSSGRSAVVYYDEDEGIMGLDGDGAGNGLWVGSGIRPVPGTWFKLQIHQNFTNKTWSASINDQIVFRDLGFHSNHIRSLSCVIVNSPPAGSALIDQLTLDSSELIDETKVNNWNSF